MTEHREFIQRAVELAAAGMRAGEGGPFGAVIVREGLILGEGNNRVLSSNDPTAHAEIVAIRDATSAQGTFSLQGATIYASSEPCPMCLAAIYWARLDSIVFAAGREIAARAGFDDAFFYDELTRSAEQRRIPCRQIDWPEADGLFDEWIVKPDRIPY